MRNYYTTQTWGYKFISHSKISFYHALLPQLSLETLYEHLPGVVSIERQKDESILVSLYPASNAEEIMKKFLVFIEQKSLQFFDTPRFYYKIPPHFRQSLVSWSLAFEGCLALLLLSDTETAPYFTNQWDYINSLTGGIYLHPFTLLLYDQYPKIVHPVTLSNYGARRAIEQTTTGYIRKMFRRTQQAQKGLEGVALLSMVTEKTAIKQNVITKIINDKCFQIKAPIYSPFFTKV